MDSTTQAPVDDDNVLPCLVFKCGFWTSCKEHPKLKTFEDIFFEFVLDVHTDRKIGALGRRVGLLLCEVCALRYDKRYEIRDHIKRHYYKKKTLDVTEEDLAITNWTIIQNFTPMVNHLMTHCLNYITDSRSRDYLDGRKRPCEICGKQVTDILLRNHLLKHVGVQNVQCAYCLSMFEDGDQLLRHLKKHSTDDKCEVCGNEFEHTLYERECHLLRHAASYPFNCLECKFRFFYPEELKLHYNTHADNHNYCEICDKGFLNILEYVRHMLTHIKQTSESCTECTNILGCNKKSYKNVCKIAVNPLFNCDTCLVSFNHFTHQRHHNLQHVEKKHRCEKCTVSFNSLNNLKKHLQIKHSVQFKDGEGPEADSEDDEPIETVSIKEFEEPFTKIKMAV